MPPLILVFNEVGIGPFDYFDLNLVRAVRNEIGNIKFRGEMRILRYSYFLAIDVKNRD